MRFLRLTRAIVDVGVVRAAFDLNCGNQVLRRGGSLPDLHIGVWRQKNRDFTPRGVRNRERRTSVGELMPCALDDRFESLIDLECGLLTDPIAP